MYTNGIRFGLCNQRFLLLLSLTLHVLKNLFKNIYLSATRVQLESKENSPIIIKKHIISREIFYSRSVYGMSFGWMCVTIVCSLIGLTMYAKYHGCDPYDAGVGLFDQNTYDLFTKMKKAKRFI